MAGFKVSLFMFFAVLVAAVLAVPQVPYDYIPIGRRQGPPQPVPHASDVNLVYEKLFPSRRKWVD